MNYSLISLKNDNHNWNNTERHYQSSFNSHEFERYLHICLCIALPFYHTLLCIHISQCFEMTLKKGKNWNQFDPIFEFTSSSRPDTREIQLIWIFKKSEFVWPCNFLSAIYFVLFSKIFKTNSGVKNFRNFDSAFSFQVILRKLRVDTDCWFILGIDTTNVSWIY